ncbi:MAG: M1 family metallopeptidase [Candidatus Vogelbacteria bacterium]|nr:M1 family metallopeptidase [Candidatus Vogelbacteria bacterium]
MTKKVIVKESKKRVFKTVKKSQKKILARSIKVRLPSHVVPEKYVIRLEPDLKEFKFKGESSLHLRIKKPVKSITLHAAELAVISGVLHSVGGATASRIEHSKNTETVELFFDRPFSGKHVLNLEFTGILNDRMEGFYKSTYKVGDETRYLAASQLESTYARQMFPCIDEPGRKAEFEFHVVVPEGKTAISNTEIVSEEVLADGKKLLKFSPTPKMSTYLGAMMVGDFENEEIKSKRGVTIRVHATPGKKSQMKFALGFAAKCLDFYEDFFGIPYPLPTLDMIAIPDFSSAGMENWGAITYREPALLIDEANSSAATKQRCAEVIAHELAHMWFGNLVTMEWWTHLWLNEGFATWASFYCMDHLEPSWHIWTQFMAFDYLVALGLDSLDSTHPIEVEVKHPSEIIEIFDAISYRKGASSIRMIAEYLGEETFKKGIQAYMKKHSHGNTVTEDLWDALSKASRKDVRKIMKNWIGKPGYPLLKISRVAKGVEIVQERFYSSEIERKKSNDKTVWTIPLAIAFGSEKNVKDFLLTKKKQIIPVDWKKNAWVNVNFKHNSFSRSLYDKELLNGFKKAKDDKQLTARDRVGLVSDMIATAKSGQLSNDALLEGLKWFADENYFTIWSVICGGLGSLLMLTNGTKYEKKFEAFSIEMLSEISKKVNWESSNNKDILESMLRSLIIGEAGAYGVRTTVDESNKRFASHLSHKSQIDPDLRSAVYNTVATHGGDAEYESMLKLYGATDMQEEQMRIAKAMMLFKPLPIVKKAIKFIFGGEVRPGDAALVITVMAGQNIGARDELWKYLTTNWKMVTDFMGRGLHYFGYVVKAIMSNMTDSQKLKEAEKFLRKNPWNGGKMSVEQAIEGAKANLAWKKRVEKELAKYFK